MCPRVIWGFKLKKTCEPQTGALLLCKVYEKSGLSNGYWSKLKPGLAKSDCFSFLHWRVIALPPPELVLRGSGLVPDFRMFQFDVAANLSILTKYLQQITTSWKHRHFLETPTFLLSSESARRTFFGANHLWKRGAGGGWPAHRATRRRGTALGRLCPVQMASAGFATPTAPTGQDAGALSSRKTPAARTLIAVAACEPASISEQHLEDAWHLQIRFREDAAALGTLKKNGSRPGYLREHIAEGLAVVQRLFGQSNTVQRLRADGRPDTQGGLVSVRMRPPLSRWHFRPAPPQQICACCAVLPVTRPILCPSVCD